MSLPADHPLLTDPELAPWRGPARALASGRFVSVLRHVQGRRVASLVESDQGLAVLKVFARPRARGNVRRLDLLAASSARHLVPRPLGVDASGHVSLVDWIDGTVYDQVDDATFVAAAGSIGVALRTLHESGAPLDRTWTYEHEVAQLRRRATASTLRLAEELVDDTQSLAEEPLVPSHRDCHPRQIVLRGTDVRFIDLDDAALAPATLDLGNVIAHIRRDVCLGRRCPESADAAIESVLASYGPIPGDLDAWTRLALARLAGLAETRHGSPEDARRILDLACV